MRQSKHFGRTSKDNPKEAQTASHQLLLKSGYIKSAGAGLFSYMPFFVKTLRRLESIVRKEMARAAFEELLAPGLQQAGVLNQSGRDVGCPGDSDAPFRLSDQKNADLILGPAAEELAVDLGGKEFTSYKHLPRRVFQIRSKYRDDARPRYGLFSSREYQSLNAFAYDADEEGLDRSYESMVNALKNVCREIGLEFFFADSQPDAPGGTEAAALAVVNRRGNEKFLICESCGYAARQNKADSRMRIFEQDAEEKPIEAVHGPGLIGVEPLAEFLEIPVWKTTKTILFETDRGVAAVCVRGDCDVDEEKVKRRLDTAKLTLASPQVIFELTGAEVGYAGPLNLPPEVIILADHYTNNRVNFECGANKTDYHYINVNWGRDLPWPEFGDFKAARHGHGCPCCERGELKIEAGFVIGLVQKCGADISEKMNCSFLDDNGEPQFVQIGSCCLNLPSLIASAVERSHDKNGVIWPAALTPYRVHLIGLNLENEDVNAEAEKIYLTLNEQDLDTLFDDRNARAGEKFQDSDMIGVPIRLTISKRMLEAGMVEIKFRDREKAEQASFEDALERIRVFYKM